jgi:predicted TIM-barrel fold metal-dependent hydrolase
MIGKSVQIDAHHHLWTLARGDYGWLTPDLAPIYRDFSLADLASHLSAAGIEGTILVQAAPTEAETMFLLDIAENAEAVRGVVGWTDFDAADVLPRIDALAARKLLVGLRPMVQDIADDDWLLGPALAPSLKAMVGYGLVFDALVKPRHLPRLLRVIDSHPDLQFVLDHCGQAAACDRRDRSLAARYCVACRASQHRLQIIGTGDRSRAGLADRRSAPSGGSCPCMLRALTLAVGKRLAGGRSGGRLCKMVRRR